ncbi:GNAT family protein [Streptomyces sp. NPDC051322]|uniref:GNAT family N-acetyltransferase n=1 Tax=Streptomyces sp. NPDC051322 TaxID=3154645 RepID=UPI00344E422C
MIADGIRFRPADLSDAEPLAAAYRRNRAHLRPWDPVRPESFFTAEGQLARLRGMLAERDAGRSAHWVLDEPGGGGGRVLGSVNLNNVALGPFCSADLGYWIDAGYTGRGLASGAVDEVCRIARDELGLHRVAAGTLLDNAASQRVLAKCGFEPFGTAPRYLHINGEWRDHRLFQRILHERSPF